MRSLNTVLKLGWNGNLKQVTGAYLLKIKNRPPWILTYSVKQSFLKTGGGAYKK